MSITERNTWDGRTVAVTWEESSTLPPREQITQASGICFTDTGRIVLVGNGSDIWSLPGGHPELGETAEDALKREVLEESCAVVKRYVYLGAQRVDNPGLAQPYYQARWWARVHLLAFTPEHEISQRILVSPDAFVTTLNWKTDSIAQAILRAALAAETRLPDTN